MHKNKGYRADTRKEPITSKQCCCSDESAGEPSNLTGEYICWCNKVTGEDIRSAIREKGARSVEEVITMTGAMVNCNCAVNNPKGTCCYPGIVQAYDKYKA